MILIFNEINQVVGKLVFLSAILIGMSSCKTETIMGVSLAEDIVFLASDSLQGRKTGTPFERIAAEYIQERMQGIGLQPKGDRGTYFQTFTFKPNIDPHGKVRFVEGDSSITGVNVIGFLDNEADKTVVIGAHYDHLGRGGEGSLSSEGMAVHNGADDNASGVGVLLQLARRLKDTLTGSNYVFIAFSGEEMGLLGSNYFTKNPTIDLKKVDYMLNLDMVGRLRENNTLSISGTGTAPIWAKVLHASNTKFNLVLNESGVGPSDHTSFYINDIPALHFFTGQHEDYHKPSDDFDKLNYRGMKMIEEYIFNIVAALDTREKLVFQATKNESENVPSFKVALGVMPDYLFEGKGMRIDGITEGRPAANAGLLKGDIVVRLGDSTIIDMMSYMRALSSFDKGRSTTVVVDRDGEIVKAQVTF